MKVHLDLGNFEACPQFNDWLDEQYVGSLNILGFQPRPSYVLFNLSQDTYQAAFDDFIRAREEGIKETVFGSFPTPIAHYFYRFENGYENELQRLYFLRDTWEAIVDILHAIAVAECRFLLLPLSKALTSRDLFSDSIAQRLLNVARILTLSREQSVHLGIEEIVSVQTLEKMRSLNQSRNAFSHSAAQSETQARAWIGECYADVVDVLEDLQGLSNIEVLRYIGHADAYTLRCEVFRGHGFTKTIERRLLTKAQAQVSQRYLQNSRILVVCDDRILAISPFVHFREEPSGHLTRLCVFRKVRGEAPNGKVEYEVVGEAVRWEEDRVVFQDDLDELRALFGLAAERARV